MKSAWELRATGPVFKVVNVTLRAKLSVAWTYSIRSGYSVPATSGKWAMLGLLLEGLAKSAEQESMILVEFK
jgi:hypothetical protein